MILLAETPALLPPSPSRDDIARSLEAARLTGWKVFEMPPDFSLCDSAENALAHIPTQNSPTSTVWLGYIPDFARYEAIYEAARAKNLVLLNSPAEHRTVQEFDLAYPFLEGLTPRSLTVASVEEATRRAPEIGFPIFVKGAVQSRKSRGWRACVAQTEAELHELCRHLLELDLRSRGRVVLREVVALRHSRKAGDFPMGREFRLFLLRGEVLACDYYWQGEDELSQLTPAERHAIETLAQNAAKRLPVPYIAIDIGQTESGEWILIETGDPQFCGLSQITPLPFWHRLRAALERKPALTRFQRG